MTFKQHAHGACCLSRKHLPATAWLRQKNNLRIHAACPIQVHLLIYTISCTCCCTSAHRLLYRCALRSHRAVTYSSVSLMRRHISWSRPHRAECRRPANPGPAHQGGCHRTAAPNLCRTQMHRAGHSKGTQSSRPTAPVSARTQHRAHCQTTSLLCIISSAQTAHMQAFCGYKCPA